MRARNRLIASTVLVLLVLVVLKLVVFKSPGGVNAQDPPDQIRLTGGVRDFKSSHPDFGTIPASQLGHVVRALENALPVNRRPVYEGGGLLISNQWFDKLDNPIRPYIPSDGGGLPGGHFDVDVFDEVTDKELYHEHQFDDKFDVSYVDLINDSNLLYHSIVGPSYPTTLRVEFLNPHHASGTYTFEADGPVQTGSARDGFTATFEPSALKQLRVDLAWLLELRGTSPGDVQSDFVDRDDAFAIRMYDVATNVLVYELAVYHHGEEGSLSLPSSAGGMDACAESIDDSIGSFGGLTDGAVTSAATFDQWYRDVLGTNLSQAHSITLSRNLSGIYEYLTDEFHPVDDQLLGNEGSTHNDLFTYMINAQFTHEACKGWFFEFEGNDDCWVFVNRDLVLDIGGAATPEEQYVALDRLGLEDGKTYTFDFFYAHRRSAPESVFRMRTNIPLSTPDPPSLSSQYD